MLADYCCPFQHRKICQPLELKTPPLQAPHPIAQSLWAPFNWPELAILYSQEDLSFIIMPSMTLAFRPFRPPSYLMLTTRLPIQASTFCITFTTRIVNHPAIHAESLPVSQVVNLPGYYKILNET
jgi:hypothetical protein